MNYAEQQRNPGKHMVGLSIVVALHVLLGWALLNGLARKVVEVIKAPIETKIIEEVKPPPPPPPENLPPPPKFTPPPPSFMPPPEVQIASPQAAPTITVQREVPPPPPPVVIAPAAPKPQAVAARIEMSTCDRPAFPPAAARSDATGVTRIRFTVDAAGRVAKAEVERSAGSSRAHRMLDRAAVDALSQCRFTPGRDEDGKAVGGVSIVEYVWKLE